MTRGWLLDTNVISELRKPNAAPQVRAWAAEQAPGTLFLSVVTMAEIRYGIERAPDAAFRLELERWIEAVLRPWFGQRILGLDEETVYRWRLLVERGRARRHTFSQPDLFIAALAWQHDLAVATRNLADFVPAGLPVLDPWSGRMENGDSS